MLCDTLCESFTPKILLFSVWPVPLSLATTRGISFDFFSSGYLDVSVPRVPFLKLCIYLRIHGSSPWGFPHSDICGSKLICSSPQLFAACHVLLRLLMPRHSPYALVRLNYFVYLSIAVLFCSLNCLSFVKQNELNLFAVILPLLLSCSFYPPFGEIVFYPFWKDLYFTNLVNNYMSSLSVRYTQIFFIRFSMIMLRKNYLLILSGGLKWTRTTDLALIRRAL